MLNVYLSGEIHTDWRQEIIDECQKEGWTLTFHRQLLIMNYQIIVV